MIIPPLTFVAVAVFFACISAGATSSVVGVRPDPEARR
jgi:hypothetical protein